MQSLLALVSVVALRASCPISYADRAGVALLATPWQYTGDWANPSAGGNRTLGAKCLGGKGRAIGQSPVPEAIALPINQAHNLNLR